MMIFISASGALRRSKNALGEKSLDLFALEEEMLADASSEDAQPIDLE